LKDYCKEKVREYIAYENNECEKILNFPKLYAQCLSNQKIQEEYTEKSLKYQQKLEYNNKILQALDAQDFSLAREILDQTVEIFSESESSLLKANLALKEGSFNFNEVKKANEALQEIEDVLLQEPENINALQLKGYAFEIKGEYEKALEAYNEVLDLNSVDSGVLSSRGHAYDLM